MPKVLNVSLFHSDWLNLQCLPALYNFSIFIQDSPPSNWLVLLRLTLQKYSPRLGQSPSGHLCVELWGSPPSQGTLPINSRLLSNPKFQTLCPLHNEIATFCTSLQKVPSIEMWVNMKLTSHNFLLSKITTLCILFSNTWQQLFHIFCTVS